MPPPKLNVRPSALLSTESTAPIGFPIVVVLLPAKRRATGLCEALLVTISEPESPPALNVLLLITTWLV